MSLLINLSGIGARATGLGVYGAMCGQILEENFAARVVHNEGYRRLDDASISSPPHIALGAGRGAALRRYRFLSRLAPDRHSLVYSPSHHFLPRARHQIVTIADLISLRHPAQHPLQSIFFKFGVGRAVRRMAAVFTISEAVKLELQQEFGLDGSRIHIVSPSVDTRVFFPAATPKRLDSKPFLLCVGGRFPHKNVHELLERHAMWRPAYALKIASCGGSYRQHLEALVKRLSLHDDVEILDFVSQPQLVSLYRSCAALVYPSKTEGFGIPPVEALACGSPVIVSDIPVHREVCGDAAFFVKLGSEDSWRVAFQGLASSESVEKKLEQAPRRVERYSRAAVSSALVAAVQSVATQEGLTLTRRPRL